MSFAEYFDSGEYAQLVHAMQSGVAMEMNYNSKPTEPKHLRVGVNSAMVEHSALVRLLVRKGFITEQEYAEALTEAMRTEVEIYEERISQFIGAKISLR